MQTPHVWFTLLCTLPLLTLGLSLQCTSTQYAWPSLSPTTCCSMCPPGKYMIRRSEDDCTIKCGECTGHLFSDSYNTNMECQGCDKCNNLGAEYESHCNGTHDAVCRCKVGFRCLDDTRCTKCVPDPRATTRPTSSTSSTTSTTTATIDTVGFLVVNVVLTLVISLFVLAKLKPFLVQWIRTRQVVPCPEDCEASKPVQEVYGKCDQAIEDEMKQTREQNHGDGGLCIYHMTFPME